MNKKLKNLFALCLTLALVFSLAACGQQEEETPDGAQDDQQTEQAEFTPVSGDFLGRFSIFSRKDYLYGFDINQKCKALGIHFDKPTAHYVKVVNSDDEYYDIYNIDDLPYSTTALYSWDVFESQFGFVTKICNFIKGIYNDITGFLSTIFRPLADLFSRNG